MTGPYSSQHGECSSVDIHFVSHSSTLSVYDGTTLHALGVCRLYGQSVDTSQNVEFYVVDTKGPHPRSPILPQFVVD